MHSRTTVCQPVAIVLVVALGLGLRGTAHAGANGDQAKALLERVATSTQSEERLRAAEELAGLAAGVVAELREFLGRKRASSFSERREVLRSIQADIPDSKGRFRSSRNKKEEVQNGDDFDWLKELAARDHTQAGYDEVFADVAAIRALAASRDPSAAEVILDFAFSDDGLLYRDECGRYLRKMAPYSLPALIVAARDSEKSRARKRYAAYQLDRMDREDPNKVLDGASADSDLLLTIIAAYGESKHREALLPLFRYAEHVSEPVREAARKALLGYVTGPEPPEAPKRKLQLPGGRYTEEEQPLWLNYRQLAEVQIREQYEQRFEAEPPRRTSSAELARAIFARMDEHRIARWNEQYDAAQALAEAGKWAEAAAMFDSILAAQPEHAKRADMVRTYFELGRALAGEKSYRAAAAAFSKAHGLASDGPLAKESLASHYANLGRALEAEGKDASAAFRRARIERPANASADDLGLPAETAPRHRWMLYAGIGGSAGALILMILGFAVRRR